MNRFVRHLLIPSIAPILFFTIALTPVDLFGCRMRGLLALSVSLFSGISAVVTGVIAIKRRIQTDPNGPLWILSTLLLAIPLVAMVFMA